MCTYMYDIYIYLHTTEIRSFLKELKRLGMKCLKSSFTKLPFSVIVILNEDKIDYYF